MTTISALYDAAEARVDFGSYSKFVHERPLFAHQQEWVRELLDAIGRGQNIIIVAPPGTFKSTTLQYLMEWLIGRDPDFTILDLMNTATQSARQISAIADTIENNALYQQVFPSIKPDKGRGWSKDSIFIHRPDANNRDATIYGTGIDGPYQGVHVNLIVVDDPTDQQDVRSEVTMQQQRERVRGVMLDRLNPGGSIIGIFTRWGEADLLRDFRDMGFHILQYPIEGRYSWGRLLFPEKYGDDGLLRLRESKDRGGEGLSTGLYMLTYMCDPSAATGSMVKRDWWQFYNALPKLDYCIHSWDLSTGRQGGDNTAFGCWGVAEQGYYLTDAGRLSVTMDDLIEKMKYLAARDRPRFILVEDVGTSIPVVDYLKKHTALPILAVKPGSRDKVARLQGVVHMIEAKRVWLPQGASWVPEYIDEHASFPGGRYDDQVDQTSQALEYLERRGEPYRASAEPLHYPSFAGGR
ncbi:MAG: phage terminase large subunit [Candidatus Nanopelagicales bacterium]|nr:phage terminase large subunit [Candidatus Nanopelagicales bacterium]